MLTMDNYQTRVNTIFESMRQRWKRKLEKSLPKGVSLQLATSEILPFRRTQLSAWLWKRIQLNAIQCPYCRAAIDILSMEVDHKIPLNRGGGPGLDNLEVVCARCNRIKAELTSDEYVILIGFFDGPGSTFRARIEGALINGSMAKMTRFFPRNKKPTGQRIRQNSLDFELDEF